MRLFGGSRVKIKLALAILFCVVVSGPVNADALPDAPYLVVKGHAETELKPDVFEVDITVTKLGFSVPEATRVVETKTKAIVDGLLKVGLDETNIKASNLEISSEYDFNEDTDKQVFLGNQVTRTVIARFASLAELHKFIDAMPTGEEVQVGGVETKLRNEEAVRATLLAEAVADSKRAAEQLANMYGQKIIGVYTISDQPLPQGGYSLDRITVTGSRIGKALAEGVVKVSKDVHVIFLMGKQ